jgi:hypothetical protein
MESKLDNVLVLERKKLLHLDRGCSILASSTHTRKAQALIFFILLGTSISTMWASVGFGGFLLFLSAAVLYPLVLTNRRVFHRNEITREVKFLDFLVQSESTPTSTLRKGHIVRVRTHYGDLWSVEYQTEEGVLSFRDLDSEQASLDLLEFLDELRDGAVPGDHPEDIP